MLTYMMEDSHSSVIKRVMTAFMQLYMVAFMVRHDSVSQYSVVIFNGAISSCLEIQCTTVTMQFNAHVFAF